MAIVHVRKQPIDIDVEAELREFNWTRPRWTSDKLLAASPFRYDQTPSFFVRLEPYGDWPAGTWSDSGAYDTEWASGGLVKLLSFLRNETYEETEEYLLNAYGFSYDTTDIKIKPPRLKFQRVRQPLNERVLADFTENYSYLESRGISADVQRQMSVLYDERNRAVVLPWRLPDGRLANVKYRKTRGKVFWYDRSGAGIPVRDLIYGIEKVAPVTVLCEAEIDAMSFRQAGYAAIAVGGASFNAVKRDLIMRSPIEELIIATDNDKAGGKLRTEVEQALRGLLRIRHAYVTGGKDANEALVKCGAEALRDAVDKSESVRAIHVKVR
ncbi:toprim domain-containing protein [Bacillus sp. JJ1503]|uniref:toprim domain-containing protein n=1 Tax=Bacillus sp. JJ1503 TaxID=3122956 RepID=UPI002FFF0776